MFNTIAQWLGFKWRVVVMPSDIARAYHATFNTEPGKVVLQHLIDEVYCQVYVGQDAIACVAFNARRALVHEILLNMDSVENPAKYQVQALLESQPANGALA